MPQSGASSQVASPSGLAESQRLQRLLSPTGAASATAGASLPNKNMRLPMKMTRGGGGTMISDDQESTGWKNNAKSSATRSG
jgi:hypothetical protein